MSIIRPIIPPVVQPAISPFATGLPWEVASPTTLDASDVSRERITEENDERITEEGDERITE